MRILLAVLAIAVMAGTAHAQDFKGTKGRGGQNTQQKADPKKQKEIDEAFKAGIKRIPDPKDKYDPWKIAR